MKIPASAALCVCLLLAAKPSPAQPPGGEVVRLPISRDAWVSAVGREADGNNGGSPRLKFKSIQEMSLVDFDPTPLKGRIVLGATLHLRLPSPDAPPLRRVTASTVAADWVEGTAANYEPQAGSVTFNHARHPDVPWSLPDGDLTTATLGQGGTFWRMADATAPDEQGWQAVPIDPLVIGACVAGVSRGMLIFDDTGSEWTREGDTFTLNLFPNRFVFSREGRRDQAPYLIVRLGPADRDAPEAPGAILVEPETATLPAGEAIVSWATPADRGGSGTVGFVATMDDRPIPAYLVPAAGSSGHRVTMHLRDLGLVGGTTHRLAVRAVDGAGNVGPAATVQVRLSNLAPKPLPGEPPRPFAGRAPLPKLGTREVAIIDELDNVHPVTGALIPGQPAGYLAANHLWDAGSRTLRLHAARNEFAAFQVVLKGDGAEVRPTLTFDGPAAGKLAVEFGRYLAVTAEAGPLPDPIAPLDAPGDAVEDRDFTSLHGEVYVPHDAPAGEHRGTLRLGSGNDTLDINVSLTVWDFTLPDHLSFLPEMNCYGLPENEREYYRLAHRHRTVLNRLPYFHNGGIADGCAPNWDGKRLDWSAWDARFGPLLDGSAFADLPRAGVPIECFYLPIFENWPTPMEGSYNGSYWADRAFPPSYREALVDVSRQFAAHFDEEGWTQTFAHFYLNGKNNFKRRGWSRGTCPWLLDEPANSQDYWALRWFGAAFHEGVNKANGDAKLVFRADISRPQWQRDSLDGLLDYNVVGGAMRQYLRMVMDRKRAEGQVVVEYGSSNAIGASNMQPVGWCLSAWSLGADGVLPWQTIGSDRSWRQADELSLFYPGRNAGEGPVPSVRLKAYRRGQQDVEYLTLLALATDQPRWAVGRSVLDSLNLAGRRESTGAGGEDAGRISFADLTPQDAWALRVRVGRFLSDRHPEPRRKLVDFQTPRRDPSKLRDRMAAEGPVRPGSGRPR